MSLIEQAKADIERITGNTNEFARSMTFVAPTSETAVVKGLHSKHHLTVNTEGIEVNARSAHVSVSEKALTDLSYPVRNSDGEVNLAKHTVKVKDSTGIEKTYEIREWFQDETIGLITCILGDFE